MGTNTERLQKALAVYVNRKHGGELPHGHFDNTNRWWPEPGEMQQCCEHIRNPSRQRPNTLLQHCRTIRHIACLYLVLNRELAHAVHAWEKAQMEAAREAAHESQH